MSDLARKAMEKIAEIVGDRFEDADVEVLRSGINSVGTLVSHEELERLRAYERELESVANILTNVHPMGAVKTIGMREASQALGEVLERSDSHEDAALLREVKRLEKSATDVEIVRNKRGWFVSLATDSSEVWHTGDDDTLTAALQSALDAAGVPELKVT